MSETGIKPKVIQEILTDSGYCERASGSPKTILKTAYQAGMIRDEEIWMAALQARNNVAHAYNQIVALDIVERTKHRFYEMFVTLKNELEDNWV
ncbi:MAG: nucleotidyltransferase substrate binding protein [Clostridiales bacterium]|nr:nucleotidyltransferase substrate binding protein [Clostridiales bacterium]